MALLFGSTFKHGIFVNAGGGGATSALVNRKYWDTVNGTGLATETTTIPPGCPASLSIPAAVTAAANLTRTFSDNAFCFGFWFRKVGATNPSAVNPRIVGVNPTNHIVRLSSSGVLQIAAANASPQTLNTPTADTWYWVTCKVNSAGGTHTFDGKIYSDAGSLIATATQSTAVTAAAPQTSFIVGTGGSMGGASVLVGCLVLDDNDANYPLLPQACDFLIPDGCGTHSFTAGNFVDDTASSLATNETTSWQKIDDWPPNTTDYVRQAVDNSNGYLEYDFGATTASRFTSVGLVQLVGAHLPSTTGANLVGQKLNDGATITAEATLDLSTAANTLEYLTHGYTTRPNGGTAWSTANVDALKARFGYMTLQPAQAGLSAFALEVFGAQSFGAAGTTIAAPVATASSAGGVPTPVFGAVATPLSTASSAASVPTLKVIPLPPAATATAAGFAPTPVFGSVAVPLSTASSAASTPTPRVTAAPPASTASAAGVTPSVIFGAVAVPVSTASVSGLTPTPTVVAAPPLTTSSAAANIPIPRVTATPPAATSSTAGFVPTPVFGAVAVPLATAASLAIIPVIVSAGAGNITIQPPAATSSAAGVTPTVITTVTAALASASSAGLTPTPQVIAAPPAAAATADAFAPTPLVAVTPPLAGVTAAGVAPTPVVAVAIPVATATALGLTAITPHGEDITGMPHLITTTIRNTGQTHTTSGGRVTTGSKGIVHVP